MPLSFESVLSACTPRTIASLRARAGINMAPSVSVEVQARAIAEWCLENDITPEELWALADCAASHKDGPSVVTYTEQAPGYAAALATLSRALGEGGAIDALGNARAFVASVSAELMAFREAARELEAAPGEAVCPALLQYLRAIPVIWTQEHGPNVCANAELLVYRADDNGQHLRVALDAAHTIHIRVSNGMGLDRTSTTHPDEVPYLIRSLIGSLAHRSLERLDGATVAAVVPLWAAEHVRRSMDERCGEYQRMKEEAQRRAWTQQDVEKSEKRRSLKMLLGQPAKP